MKSFSKAALFLSGWIALGWCYWTHRSPEVATVFESPAPLSVEVEKIHPASELSEPPRTASGWQTAFEMWAAKPEFESALVGLVLLDADSQVVYASSLGETALCPASTLKTLTTGAAFGILGPQFRFETRLIHRPGGNLALVGSGDPTLTLKDLENLAADAVKAGLTNVTGDLVADVSVFTTPPVNDHWNWGDIGNAYGVGAFGLNVDHNRMSVRFQPGAKSGDSAKFLGGSPVAAGTDWVNDVTTGSSGSGDGVAIYSSPGARVISLRGTVPQGSAFTVGGAIPDPPTVALEALRSALGKAGITFSKESVPRTGEAVVVATHRSAALPEIIDHLHKVSDNLEAQCLFLTLGNQAGKNPSAAVREYWEKAGVDFEGLRLIDGSGLARANMIRPLDLARVNLAARRGPHGERYFQSLNPSLSGAVRAKLGSMSGVKTDVGFLRLQNGKEITFALMANGLDPALSFWPLRGELLKSLREAAE